MPPYGAVLVGSSLKQLKSALDTIAVAGDGTSPAQRRSFVVLLSDGIEDSVQMLPGGTFPDGRTGFYISGNDPDWNSLPGSYNYVMQPFSASYCSQLKADNRKVLTAQVRFEIPYGIADDWWNPPKANYISSKQAELESAFRDCASDPSYHFIAEKSSEIEPVLEKIIGAIGNSRQLRLTR